LLYPLFHWALGALFAFFIRTVNFYIYEKIGPFEGAEPALAVCAGKRGKAEIM
jgi:hypothetical protein